MIKNILKLAIGIILIPAMLLAQPHGGAIQSTKINDGTDTATIASTLDSRNGLDVQQSSIASKSIINFSSLNVSDRLLASASKVFSPGGTRATYYDLQGYGNLLINFSDNTGGALGGTLYVRWSGDGTNTSNNDPGDGTGGANYSTLYNTTTDGLVVKGRILPLGGRYVNFVYVNNAHDQGNSGTNFCDFTVNAIPIGFSSDVRLTNTSVPVVGAVLTASELAGQPVVIGGVDSVSSPTAANALVVSATGEISSSELPATATAADATTNPSISKLGSYLFGFNGTTWDRLRTATNSVNSTGTGIQMKANVAQYDDTSPSAVTENQFALLRMSSRRALYNASDCNAVTLFSGTSPASATTTAQTAVTDLGQYRSAAIYANIRGATGGTLDIYIQYSPDAGTTWVDYAHYAQLAAAAAAIDRTFMVSKSGQQTTITTIGTGTTPALAAGTVVGGSWGDRMRVVTVAGAGTSAGATQTIKAIMCT